MQIDLLTYHKDKKLVNLLISIIINIYKERIVLTVENVLHVKIKPHWEVVNEIHYKTEKMIFEKRDLNIDKNSIVMVATELIENAVKYGQSRPGCQKIDFSLLMEDCNIKIIVKNGIRYEEDLNNIKERILQIKETHNLKKLFEKRLLELLNNPDCGKAQLGLFRIVYEGRFNIDYSYKDKIVTVTAERSF